MYHKTCDGTLAIFLGTGTNMDSGESYKIEIWNGRTMVSTRSVIAHGGRAVWNESLHLPVHIHAETKHRMNAVVFILKDGKKPRYFVYHLFDIVPRDSYIADIVFLPDDDKSEDESNPPVKAKVASVKAKVAFLYGTFGFGRSLMIASGFPDDIQKRAKSMFEYVHMPQRRLYDKLFRNDDDLKTVAGWLEDANDDITDLEGNWSKISKKIWTEILGPPEETPDVANQTEQGHPTSSGEYTTQYSTASEYTTQYSEASGSS